jgi:hypothetical protein
VFQNKIASDINQQVRAVDSDNLQQGLEGINLDKLSELKCTITKLVDIFRTIERMIGRPDLNKVHKDIKELGKVALRRLVKEQLSSRFESDIKASLQEFYTTKIKEPFYQAYPKNSDFTTNLTIQELLIEQLPRGSELIFEASMKELVLFINESKHLISSMEERKSYADELIEAFLNRIAHFMKRKYPSPRLAAEINGLVKVTQTFAQEMNSLLNANTLRKVNDLWVYDLDGLEIRYLPFREIFTAGEMSSKSFAVKFFSMLPFITAASQLFLFIPNFYNEENEKQQLRGILAQFTAVGTSLRTIAYALPVPILERGQLLSMKRAKVKTESKSHLAKSALDLIESTINEGKKALKSDQTYKKMNFKVKNQSLINALPENLAQNLEKKFLLGDAVFGSLLVCFEGLSLNHADSKNAMMQAYVNETLSEALAWATKNKAEKIFASTPIKIALLKVIDQLMKLSGFQPNLENLQRLGEAILNQDNLPIIFEEPSGKRIVKTRHHYLKYIETQPDSKYAKECLAIYEPLIDFILNNKTIIKNEVQRRSHTARLFTQLKNPMPSFSPLEERILISLGQSQDDPTVKELSENLSHHPNHTLGSTLEDGIIAILVKMLPLLPAAPPTGTLTNYIQTNGQRSLAVQLAKKLSPLLTKEQVLTLKDMKRFDLKSFDFEQTLMETLLEIRLKRKKEFIIMVLSILLELYSIFSIYEPNTLVLIITVPLLTICYYAPAFLENNYDLFERYRHLSAELPLENTEWIDIFEETPLPQPTPPDSPTEKTPSPKTPPSPPPVENKAPVTPPSPAKPWNMTDWNKVADQLTTKYHQFKKSLSKESTAAESLFKTANPDKKSMMLMILKYLQNNPSDFYDEKSQSLNHEIIEDFILDKCNAILSSGEAKITRGIQPLPPAQGDQPQAPQPAPMPIAPMAPLVPAAPVIAPLPAKGLASSGSSSSGTKKPSTPAYAKIKPEIHQKRIAGIARRYGPNTEPLPASDQHYLAMKFDLLELCERMKKLCPLLKDRINRIRNGLLHHDAAIDPNLKIETYQGLLRDFAAHYSPDSIRPAEGLLSSNRAAPLEWIMRDRPKNTIEGIAPIDYFNERCQAIVRFYDEMITQIETNQDPALPRKAMMMNIIEIGVLFSHMILERQDLSLLMRMEQVILFTNFRKSFCHVDSEASLQQIQQNLESIHGIVSDIVTPNQSSRVAAVFK